MFTEKKFRWLCRRIKASQPIIYFAIAYALVGYLLFSQPSAQAQSTIASTESSIDAVRLGKWPNKSRLVFEGREGMHAQVISGSQATIIRLRLSLPSPHHTTSWLKNIVPQNHHAIKSLLVTDISATQVELTVHFYRPTVAEIFNLRAMEGFQPRLVIDFYEADFALEELWVDVNINGNSGFGTVLALAFEDNDVLISESDLKMWRVKLLKSGYLEYFGENYYSLHDLGIGFLLNRAQLQLNIQIPAQQFAKLNLQGHQRQDVQLTRSNFGFYLNYDLTAYRHNATTSGSGYAELGIFNHFGTLNHRTIARYDDATQQSEMVRLDTVWRSDFPDAMASLYLGDFITRTASWNRNLHAAGIKWETNFETQPELIKQPTLAFTGLATEPSTVDLFINDALRFRRDIPAGPFSIDDLPTITGYGDVQMVITDALGRTQRVTQNYFTDRRLLRTGLHEYSYALGSIRRNYGFADSDYHHWLANAYHRIGISNNWTAEYAARFSSAYEMLSLGSVFTLPWHNSLNFSVAASRSDGRHGQLIQLGVQHQRRGFNFGVDAQKSFNDFQIDPPQVESLLLPEFQLTSFISWSSADLGSFRVAYTEQQRITQDVAFINAGYSTSLNNWGYLSLNAVKFLNDKNDFQLSLTLNFPLGERTNFTTGATRYSDRKRGYAQLQRQAPTGYGLGYRIRQGLLTQPVTQAEVQAKTPVGNYQLSYENNPQWASVNRETSAYRFSARGSLSAVGGYISVGQPIHDSFGLVRLPEFPNVRIYSDNQHVATTDHDGTALIPRLRAYQRNRIRVDAKDIPLHADFSSLQQEISPYHRSGVVIEFPISNNMSIVANVVDTNGEYIPVGAQAFLNATNAPVTIGYDGLLYLTSAPPDSENRLKVTVNYYAQKKRVTCVINIPIPQSTDKRVDLGVTPCL
ncbi:fimbria/pilus outer membrane usher protein [Pseudidiomarina sp.]|uniref:fimbria/pilus outer membrane usher protein n=1 Tax=Pseudidiomarina sp. TaxID=2081707 RepID=UPI003A96EF1D